ncbi:MAG: hypothetical protein ABI177_15325 [Edaphobacter sp.]
MARLPQDFFRLPHDFFRNALDQGGIRQTSCTRFVDPAGNIRLRTCFAVVVPGLDKHKIRIDGTSMCVESVRSQAKLLPHSQPRTGMYVSGKEIEPKSQGNSVCAFPIALARWGTRSLSTPWQSSPAQHYAAKLYST